MWDVLFYEGAKVLFHVALAIFKVPFDLSFYYDTLFFQNTVLVHDLEAHINSFSSYLSIAVVIGSIRLNWGINFASNSRFLRLVEIRI